MAHIQLYRHRHRQDIFDGDLYTEITINKECNKMTEDEYRDIFKNISLTADYDIDGDEIDYPFGKNDKLFDIDTIIESVNRQ